MLTVLNFRPYGLIHYYEDRDNGLYHVIRDNNYSADHLSNLISSTGFVRDQVLLGDLRTASMAAPDFSGADGEAIKSLFPETKAVSVPKESITYKNITHYIDINSYAHKNSGSYFDPKNHQEFDCAYEIQEQILAGLGFFRTSDGADKEAAREKVSQALTRFLTGELSGDTSLVWKEFFDTERAYLNAADVRSPIWKPYFDRIDTSLELILHPGAPRIYSISSASSRIKGLMDEAGALSLINKYGSVTPVSPDLPVFYAVTAKQSVADLVVESAPMHTMGIIEIERDRASNISTLINIRDLPIGTKIQMIDSGVTRSVAAMAKVAIDISLVVDDAFLFIGHKPTQVDYNNKVIDAISKINAAIGFSDKPVGLSSLRYNGIILSAGIKPSVDKLCHEVDARYRRVVRVFGRALLRSEAISDIGARKTHLQSLLNDHINSIRGIGELSSNNDRNGRSRAFESMRTDIDFKFIVDERVPFESNQVIAAAFLSYGEALAVANKAAIQQQQEESRADLQSTAVIAVDPDIDVNLAVKHADVGEKIGGARKDAYGSLSSSTIHQFTLDEQAKYVIKTNIWPKPDWKAMIALGVRPADAYAIKQLRDVICPRPETLSTGYYSNSKSAELAETEKDFAAWLSAIEIVKDSVAAIASADDFLVHMKLLSESLKENVLDRPSFTHFHALGNAFKKKYLFPDKLSSTLARNAAYYETGVSDPYFLKKLKILPIKPVAIDSESNESKDKDNENKVKAILPYPAHLKSLTRVGDDWRDGKDITGETLIATFGFRGVEYGNWVPNAERQVVLNHAFDAFMDLAYVIGLSSDKLDMISMNGALALGFGSRGSGHALAHYEPLRDVINITKIKGAGSLAHEWFHAFDAYLGRLTGVGHIRERLFSEVVSAGDLKNLTREIEATRGVYVADMASSVISVLQLAVKKPRNQWAVDRDIESAYFSAADHLGSWSRSAALHYLKANTDSSAYPKMEKDKLIAFLKTLNLGSGCACDAPDVVLKMATIQVVEALGMTDPAYARQAEKITENISLSGKAVRQAGIGINALARGIRNAQSSTAPMETDFLVNAKLLDGKSRKNWRSACELLARSFAVFVYEALEEDSRQSDYLVRGAARNQFADMSIYKGNSNPEGDERDVLNAAYRKLMSDMYVFAANEAPKHEDDGAPSL